MASRIDIVGQKFGRLMVLADAVSIRTLGGQSKRRVIALCDCGNEIKVNPNYLRSGHTQSCGCLSTEKIISRNTSHGDAKTQTSEYRAWAHLIGRCENPKIVNFHNYGGRGIAVCDRWRESYEAFLADMGRKPSPKHSLDRRNNNGPYSPENCRWATRKEQMRNMSTNHLITYRGKTMPLVAWAEEVGISRYNLSNRLHLGWSVSRALREPLRSWPTSPKRSSALTGTAP